jgi:hypothetical protein
MFTFPVTFWSSSGSGGIGIIQQVTHIGAGSVSSINTTIAATTAGSLLVVVVNAFSSPTPRTIAVADATNGSYTQAGAGGTVAANYTTGVFYFPNTAAGITTITATFSGTVSGGSTDITVFELSGAALTVPLDTSGAVNNGVAVSNPVTAALTTSVGGDFIVASCVQAGAGSVTAVNSPYTGIFPATGSGIAYHIPAGTVTGEQATFTITGTAGVFASASGAFKHA